ncbi:Crp/Fnr family transcriptional regulator [Apibacter raozihei]|uniref:Crp/Fnr family transcriptional regulator n=1 Tax=Apibacter raozihei TaxID=2500547 RepID=UPI000FE2C2B4|nr:Crp/Fnr family transcriptional regulator [Apibacter raozihei]
MIHSDVYNWKNEKYLPALAVAELFSEKYCTLPIEALNHLSLMINTTVYTKGEIILNIGQTAKDILYVEKGILRQYYFKDDFEITEHFTCNSQVTFCIESLFEKKPTKLLIEAVETSIIHAIPYQGIVDLTHHYPAAIQLLQKILETSLIISQKKADSWRLSTASERYKRFMKEYPSALLRAPVKHIASYLSMAPESLSRIRKTIAKIVE